MPANDENIRRRWYSVVDIELLGEVLLDKVDKPVECRDHKASFNRNPGRSHPGRARPLRSDPIG
jgi:hypothetical protein